MLRGVDVGASAMNQAERAAVRFEMHSQKEVYFGEKGEGLAGTGSPHRQLGSTTRAASSEGGGH